MFQKLNLTNASVFLLVVFATQFGGLSATVQAQRKCRPQVLITIKREVCFGSCPSYSAQIESDGTVKYEGQSNVKATGKRQHKIDKARLKELVKAFARAKYFSLKDRYETDEEGNSVTDQPTTTTSICLKGKRKQVVNYYMAPGELEELENTIERLAGLYEYIGPL